MKQSKTLKCKVCRDKIPKGKEKYFEGNIVCQKHWNQLKNPIPENRANSFIAKLIESVKLRRRL